MNKELQNKYSRLKEFFHEHEEIVLAYSGGVDSTLLLKVAKDELGDEALAIMGKSDSMPEREYEDAMFVASEIGIEPIVIHTREIDSPDYCSNPVDRCYHCKKHIFGSFVDFMREKELLHLIDGSNFDDSKDYRPGSKALAEFDVISPLKDLGFTKEDIRELSKELGLSTWKKEAMACLASRIAYNDPITVEKLRKIDSAEEYLRKLKFTHVRARIQNDSLRIEVDAAQVQRFFDYDIRQQVLSKMKELGFKNISIDMDGYRMGSMNENVN